MHYTPNINLAKDLQYFLIMRAARAARAASTICNKPLIVLDKYKSLLLNYE
jgi:hypothetical protein